MIINRISFLFREQVPVEHTGKASRDGGSPDLISSAEGLPVSKKEDEKRAL